MDPIPPSEEPEKAIKAFSPIADILAESIDECITHALRIHEDPNKVLLFVLEYIEMWFGRGIPFGNNLAEAIEEEVQKRCNNMLEWKYQTLPMFYFE